MTERPNCINCGARFTTCAMKGQERGLRCCRECNHTGQSRQTLPPSTFIDKCGRCAGHEFIQGIRWDDSNLHSIKPIGFKQRCPNCVEGIPRHTIQAFRDGTNRNPVDLTDQQIAWGLITAMGQGDDGAL